MPISNTQYDRIMRIYSEKQNRSGALLARRKNEVYQKLPEYGALEDEKTSLFGAMARARIMGDDVDEAGMKARIREISEEKERVLVAAGYPADYLEPVYECPDCRDTGYKGNEKCHCLKQSIASMMYEQSHLGDMLDKENFSVLSFKYHKGDDLERYKQAVKGAHEFIDRFPSGENLLLFGPVGSGKTFLSKCIAREVLDAGHVVLYFSAESVMDILTRRLALYDGDPYDDKEELMTCDLLIIDDLGTEYPNGLVVSKFFGLINNRLNYGKSTIISTNLSLENIQESYSARIFSRIIKGFSIYRITCDGDIRHKIASAGE